MSHVHGHQCRPKLPHVHHRCRLSADPASAGCWKSEPGEGSRDLASSVCTPSLSHHHEKILEEPKNLATSPPSRLFLLYCLTSTHIPCGCRDFWKGYLHSSMRLPILAHHVHDIKRHHQPLGAHHTPHIEMMLHKMMKRHHQPLGAHHTPPSKMMSKKS